MSHDIPGLGYGVSDEIMEAVQGLWAGRSMINTGQEYTRWEDAGPEVKAYWMGLVIGVLEKLTIEAEVAKEQVDPSWPVDPGSLRVNLATGKRFSERYRVPDDCGNQLVSLYSHDNPNDFGIKVRGTVWDDPEVYVKPIESNEMVRVQEPAPLQFDELTREHIDSGNQYKEIRRTTEDAFTITVMIESLEGGNRYERDASVWDNANYFRILKS